MILQMGATIKNRKNEPIKVVSLFSGCGGMDLGFVGGFEFLGKQFPKTDFEIVWANEIDKDACETYRKNLNHDIVEGDINKVLDKLPECADIVIGGFPCQDISINGKMRGIAGSRSGLYTAIVEAVRRLQPKMFVAENVGSLLMKQHEQSLNQILNDFKGLGYEITYQLYNAADYGVPQTRERIFIVGTRKDIKPFAHPKPSQSNRITVKEAINDLAQMPKNQAIAHIWSEARASGEQGSRKLIAERAGYTVRAECHGQTHFHYDLPRRISMREAARIQSFPDTFVFPPKIRATERQIGNAVPPVLAWHVATAIERTLRGAKI